MDWSNIDELTVTRQSAAEPTDQNKKHNNSTVEATTANINSTANIISSTNDKQQQQIEENNNDFNIDTNTNDSLSQIMGLQDLDQINSSELIVDSYNRGEDGEAASSSSTEREPATVEEEREEAEASGATKSHEHDDEDQSSIHVNVNNNDDDHENQTNNNINNSTTTMTNEHQHNDTNSNFEEVNVVDNEDENNPDVNVDEDAVAAQEKKSDKMNKDNVSAVIDDKIATTDCELLSVTNQQLNEAFAFAIPISKSPIMLSEIMNEIGDLGGGAGESSSVTAVKIAAKVTTATKSSLDESIESCIQNTMMKPAAPPPSTINSDYDNNNNSTIKHLNRYNYRCKTCSSYSTKFKVKIIEHMQVEHGICVMQCPDATCGKRFKDEWKLKRHLISNREHQSLDNYKTLNDVMKIHIEINLQKTGFPCPMCRQIVNETSNRLEIDDEENEETIEKNKQLINDKHENNFLYLNDYDELVDHLIRMHPKFNLDNYFICKLCGQVFLSKYKLSCHSFNVHSGKRKNRSRSRLTMSGFNDKRTNDPIMDSINATTNFILHGISNNSESEVRAAKKKRSSIKDDGADSIDYIIDNVARGRRRQSSFLLPLPLMPELNKKQRFYCEPCKRFFKRERDIYTHTKIMHKEVDINQVKFVNIQKQQPQQPQSFNLSNMNSKKCPICFKLFKDANTNSSMRRSFVRHMQTQHGLNENGERLIECPVCEKNFFNRQQLERHMHTHESWTEMDTATDDVVNLNVNVTDQLVANDNFENLLQLNESDQLNSSNSISDAANLAIESVIESIRHNDCGGENGSSSAVMTAAPDFQTSHSILYCHECTECKRFYKSTKILTKHKREVHKLKPIYYCAEFNHCNRVFESVVEFLEHARMHPQRNIVCSRCKEKFLGKNSLRNHLKTVHYSNSRRQAVRETTGSSTSAKSTIAAAGATKKRTNSKQQQQLHSTTFINHFSNSNIRNQIQQQFHNHHNHHQQQQQMGSNFYCHSCQRNFSSKNSLHNHLATHGDAGLFLCEVCNLTFSTRKDLSKHTASHDSSKHKTCEKCDMTFKTSFHLKRHMLTRHSNVRPFTCDQCEMTFARKDKLKQHEAKHVNHPLFKCSQCEKGFYRKEHLKDHEISKHSKQYPFSCEHCNKGFVHAKDLHRHIRVRHLGMSLVAANNAATISLTAGKYQHQQQQQQPFVTLNQNFIQQQTHQIATNNNTRNNNKKVTVDKQTRSKLNALAKQTATTSGKKNQKISAVSLVTTVKQQPPTEALAQNLNFINNNISQQPQPHPINLSNDFKSKKISSILKSTQYLNQQNQIATVAAATSVSFQPATTIYQAQPINLTSSQPLHFLTPIATTDSHQHQLLHHNQHHQQQQQQQYQQHQFQQQQQQQRILMPLNALHDLNSNINATTTNNSNNIPQMAQIIDLSSLAFNSNNNQAPTTLTMTSKTTALKNSRSKVESKRSKKLNSNNFMISNNNEQQPQQQVIFANYIPAGTQFNISNQQEATFQTTTQNIISIQQQGDGNKTAKYAAAESNNKTKKKGTNSIGIDLNNPNITSTFLSATATAGSADSTTNASNSNSNNNNITVHQFTCSYCKKSFTNKTTAKAHIDNSHSTFKCPICLQAFSNRQHTNRHIANDHHDTTTDVAEAVGTKKNQFKPIKETKVEVKLIESVVVAAPTLTINEQQQLRPFTIDPIINNKFNNNNNNQHQLQITTQLQPFNTRMPPPPLLQHTCSAANTSAGLMMENNAAGVANNFVRQQPPPQTWQLQEQQHPMHQHHHHHQNPSPSHHHMTSSPMHQQHHHMNSSIFINHQKQQQQPFYVPIQMPLQTMQTNNNNNQQQQHNRLQIQLMSSVDNSNNSLTIQQSTNTTNSTIDLITNTNTNTTTNDNNL